MKNLFLLATILLFTKIVISQTYHPIIKNNKSWDQVYSVYGACWTSCKRYEFIDGETIIDGVAYRNSIYYPFLGTPGPNSTICPPYSISYDQHFFAWMREDTIARKVYIYDYYSTPKDQLLYDFTLNIGDTLHSAYAGQGDTLVLYSIETVSLANGELRQKFCFDAECQTSYTEEIGGRNGLFQPIIPMYGYVTPLVLCIQDEGEILSGNQCDIYFVGIENTGEEPVTIFPNPFRDRFTVKLKTVGLPAVIEITDLQGKIFVNQILRDNKSEITIPGLDPGMYYYRISSGKNICRGKLINY